MTINDENLLSSILDSFRRIDYIKPADIPDIDLYMDQVTTFMDTHLSSAKRYPDDKILTKTMINNYTKAGLMPPPEKKKYSKEHMLMLIFIYYFKNILSINDLQQVLHPLKEKYFSSDGNLSLTDIYNEVFGLEKNAIKDLTADIKEKFKLSQETFKEAPAGDQELLQNFSMICMLSFDVFMKKMLIEKMIDMTKDEYMSEDNE